MLVSVIIPTYNRLELLKRAVKSVLSQTFSSFEIIVANDAGESVESMLKLLDTGQGCIRLVNIAQKSGVSTARNMALSIAKGKYIAYLDDDDYYYPEHLEILYNYLENTGAKVVYSDALSSKQEKQGDTWVTLEKKLQHSKEFNSDLLLVHNYIPILTIMHAKECFEKSGMFDETLSTHEDWDLLIRISRHYIFHHIPQVTSEYTYRPSYEQEKNRKIYKNNFIITRKRIYKRYASFVTNKPQVLKNQQEVLNNSFENITRKKEIKIKIQIFAKKHSVIYIYGAGEWGERVAKILKYYKIDYKGFIVSKKQKNIYLRKPILELSEVVFNKNTGIILGLDKDNSLEVLKILQKIKVAKNCILRINF